LSPIGGCKMGWLAGDRNMDTVTQRIARWRLMEERLAEQAKQLALRELDGRVLRLTLETELRQGDAEHVALVKTEAEKEAKAHPRYLAHERESIQLTFDRAVLEAAAKAEAYGIELQLGILQKRAAVPA
jgi:hypothetical protein